MKTQDGKFVLFFDLLEFAAGVGASSFSRVIRLLPCHHTYIPRYSNFQGTNHFELLHAMETAHLQRGFSEIAQNLTTFPDWTVAVCRSIDTIAAASKAAPNRLHYQRQRKHQRLQCWCAASVWASYESSAER